MKMNKKPAAIIVFFSLAMMGLVMGLQVEIHAQGQAFRVNDRQVEQMIRSIERRSDTFRSSFDSALDRSRFDNSYTESSVNEFIKAFEHATDELRSRFNDRRAVATDVGNVLSSAAVIEQFMRANLRQNRVQQDWILLKGDLRRLANAYGVVFSLNDRVLPPLIVAIQPAYRVSDSQVEAVLRRVETKSDTFRISLDNALDQSRLDDTNREDNINEFVRQFEEATDELRSKFNGRTSVGLDVSNVLVRAARIDDFMRRNLQRHTIVQRNWNGLRRDLNLLSSYYNVGFDLNNRRGMPPYPMVGLN
jgi:hypothetical protein